MTETYFNRYDREQEQAYESYQALLQELREADKDDYDHILWAYDLGYIDVDELQADIDDVA